MKFLFVYFNMSRSEFRYDILGCTVSEVSKMIVCNIDRLFPPEPLMCCNCKNIIKFCGTNFYFCNHIYYTACIQLCLLHK